MCYGCECHHHITSVLAKFSRYTERAASTAPPPGTRRLDSSTLLTTHSASWMDLSISSTMKSLAPLKMMEDADRTLGLIRVESSQGWTQLVETGLTHPLTSMSSSSQTLSCTTSSAWPSMDGSKLSSPSRLASVRDKVAGRDMYTRRSDWTMQIT